MIDLAIVCAVLIALPFVLSYLHLSFGSSENANATLLGYRYFATFNILLAAIFVAGRLLLNGRQAAQTSGWAYSPIFHLYAVAVLSMGVLALFTVYRNNVLALASALCWSIFLLLSTMALALQLYWHEIGAMPIIYVHVIYNVVVAAVLLFYSYRLRDYFTTEQSV